MPRDLNSVDWASLTHAYGFADDVPDLIRELRSPDAEARRRAMWELYGNIYHQGTRYEASAHAVPFLLDLVADVTTPDRQEIIRLLASLATGCPPYELPASGFPIADDRRRVAQVPAQCWARWSRAMKDWHQVAEAGLRTPPPAGRARTAPARDPHRAPDAAVAELRGWAARRREDREETIWGARPSDVALRVLDAFVPPVAAEVRSGLVAQVLAEQSTSNWRNDFIAVLASAFPDVQRPQRRGFAELTAAQRAAVSWLVDNPHVFESSGPHGQLRYHGLSTTHEALCTYAGLN